MKKTPTLIAAAALVLAVAAPAAARPYISAQQAVAAAKAKVAGRVTDVDAEFDSRRPHYDVDIVSKRGRKHEIKVDARTGRVYANRIDYD